MHSIILTFFYLHCELFHVCRGPIHRVGDWQSLSRVVTFIVLHEQVELCDTSGLCDHAAGDVHPNQLRTSPAGTRCCDWSRDWDDGTADNWHRARWLVRWLRSARTNLVDSWHHAVTASGISCISCSYQLVLHPSINSLSSFRSFCC